MSSSFKRKTYGPSKPVPKAKIVPPTKPSVLDLHRLYRQMSTATIHQHIDFFAKVMYWWQDAVKYLKHKRPTITESAAISRALLSAYDWTRKGQAATTNDEKERCFLSAVESYRKYASGLIDTNDVKPYVKAYRENTKKKAVVIKKLAPRFDPFLTILSACFNSCPLTFQVVPDIQGARGPNRKFDHAVGKMLYTRALIVSLMKQYRAEGLLAVVIDEARHLSRAMAFEGMQAGSFIVNKDKQLTAYMQLMDDFCTYAQTHPEAPNRIVKRLVPKKPSTRAPRVPRTKMYKEPSINSQILNLLVKKGGD